MKLIVDRNELRAALLFVSTDETRFVLNSICIEVRPNSQPIMVATDGKRLAVIETDAIQELDETPLVFDKAHSFNLRPHVAATIIALSKSLGFSKMFPLVCLENKPGSKQFSATLIGASGHLEIEDGALVEGTYPEWRKVIPAKTDERTPVKEIAISSTFVSDYAKAGKALDAKSLALSLNLIGKDSAIEVKIGELRKFYSVIMPCKVDDQIDFQPSYLKGFEPESKAA